MKSYLSPPSYWQMNLTNQRPTYKHASLDRPAGCPCSIVVYTLNMAMVLFLNNGKSLWGTVCRLNRAFQLAWSCLLRLSKWAELPPVERPGKRGQKPNRCTYYGDFNQIEMMPPLSGQYFLLHSCDLSRGFHSKFPTTTFLASSIQMRGSKHQSISIEAVTYLSRASVAKDTDMRMDGRVVEGESPPQFPHHHHHVTFKPGQ